jgi:alkanesulfonate monooxygenase SsuD/methylene tetrahydromethanopterin reductase-like flavin-dependent oxidoreductase (luciferase family)
MFSIRYDLRIPPGVTLSHAEQYRNAIEMAVWADQRGFAGVGLSEHHGTDDGFLNSPLTLAAAILGATTHLTCRISALLVPLHDPIRLAEEIATVDVIAPGRLSIVAGLGYRPSEFEMYGKDLHTRARDFDEAVEVMMAAWQARGGEVLYRGRRVRVRPAPATQPHPHLLIGGSVPASARRAARLRLPYSPAIQDQQLVDIYLAEAAAIGFDAPIPPLGRGPGLVLVTRDPDQLWDRIGDQLLYDAQIYRSWLDPGHRSSWETPADTVDDLRASPNYAIVTPEECVELVSKNGAAALHPLAAGIDPEIGWETLRLVADEVMPALAAAGPP